MADTSAFPAIHDPDYLVGPMNRVTMSAAAAIKPGMGVAFADTGVSMTVTPALQNTGVCIGVALTEATQAGDLITVAVAGPIVYMCEGAGTTIDAGHWVMIDDCALGGCIIEYDPAIGTHAATLNTPGAAGCAIGIALDDFAANGTGRVLLMPQAGQTASS
jgi:hypothetical protein